MMSRLTVNNKTKYDEVFRILSKAPKSGLYQNEKYQDWQNFFKIFCKFLQSEEGPRGEAIKFSRKHLEKDKKTTQHVIKTLGLRKNYLIRDVYVRFKQYNPTPLLSQYQISVGRLKEIEFNAKNISDTESYIHKSIEKGLINKHGDQYDVSSKIREIVEVYSEKVTNKQSLVSSLYSELNMSQKYQEYQKMKKYLEPIIEMFDRVERQIGLSNVERGKSFEQKCRTVGLEELFQKIGKRNFEVVMNCRWEPQDLGEVDLALIETVNGVRTVTVLIQCKARIFDMCAGMKQIGPERLLKNKRVLRIGRQNVPVLDNAQHFIMINLPSIDYHLPFESRLKAELEKATKSFEYSQLDAEKIYDNLFPKFQSEMSPLDWFKENAEKHLIII